jgi:hypothetical protein
MQPKLGFVLGLPFLWLKITVVQYEASIRGKDTINVHSGAVASGRAAFVATIG